MAEPQTNPPRSYLNVLYVEKYAQASNYVLGECLPDVCASACERPGGGRCVCASQIWPQERFTEEKDANQQEVKLSAQQQDSGPEVSGVTCQAKEITARHRPTTGCAHQWTAASQTHCQHTVKSGGGMI